MKKVLIYSSDSCGYCTMAKDYLKSKGISYEEKNISSDKEARQDLMKKGFMGVPVIYVDDEVVHGFDKDKLNQLLGL